VSRIELVLLLDQHRNGSLQNIFDKSKDRCVTAAAAVSTV
jgi:hypothetical protein